MTEGVYIEVGDAAVDVAERRVAVEIRITSKHDEPRRVLDTQRVEVQEVGSRATVILPWVLPAVNHDGVHSTRMAVEYWYPLRQAVHRAIMAWTHAFLGRSTPNAEPLGEYFGKDTDAEAVVMNSACALLAKQLIEARNRIAQLEQQLDGRQLAEEA